MAQTHCMGSIGSSGWVRGGGQETLNLCDCLWWPSFYDLFLQGQWGMPPPPHDALLTGPGLGQEQGQGTGLGMMGFYIILCTVHTAQG